MSDAEQAILIVIAVLGLLILLGVIVNARRWHARRRKRQTPDLD